MLRRILQVGLVPLMMVAASTAYAVEPLGDAGLIEVAGKDGVKLGTQPQAGVSAGPQAGHPSQDAKERAAGTRIEALENQLEAQRAQQPALGSELRGRNADLGNLVPETKAELAYPKSISTVSPPNLELPASIGTVQRTNVQIDGGIRFGSTR